MTLYRLKGWTLLELMVTLVIVGLVVGVGMWRVNAWKSSADTTRLKGLSETWQAMRSLAMEQAMRVSCEVSSRGWHCSQWGPDLSGQLGWLALTGYPWEASFSWPAGWQWGDEAKQSQRIELRDSGQVIPAHLSLCHPASQRCWLWWEARMVSS